MKFFRTLFRQFAFDLGSLNTRIWVEGKGVVINEPTCLAIAPSGEVLATGKEAVEIAGRQNQDVQIIWPVEAGVIMDESALIALLKVWLRPYFKPTLLLQPTVLVSTTAESTQANRSVIRSVFEKLGAVEVITIAQPLAAAIGSGVHTADATGSFYLHLGDGVVEAGVVSLGSIMVTRQSLLAGHYLAEQMSLLLNNDHNLIVDSMVVEKIKREVFSLLPDQNRMQVVMGKSSQTLRPIKQEVAAKHLVQLAQQLTGEYTTLLFHVLEEAAPALLVDSLDKGLLLSGGLAQLHGLDRALSTEFKMPVSVVDNPDLVVIEGMSKVLEHLDDFRQSLSYHAELV
ncbi:MAG TPA: rod shape-determining protein [Candidatus Woesebacteria bacterium]|nr:rod shape-determining protein [Candidatus Woesebacteria bacterium]HNS65082.1 rod shape-determining protein [Candidatus Woesebacteria bacterium]